MYIYGFSNQTNVVKIFLKAKRNLQRIYFTRTDPDKLINSLGDNMIEETVEENDGECFAENMTLHATGRYQ